jgi:trigger factor
MEQKNEVSSPTAEYSNDLVHVVVHRRPACCLELAIEAKPSLVARAQKEAIQMVAKEVTFPGFRKGKVPETIIAKNHAPQIDKEWQNRIADSAFQESIKLIGIPPLEKNPKVSFKMESHSMEGGAKLSLSFETVPVVPTIDPKAIRLKKVDRVDVTPENIEAMIRQIQLFFATWAEIDDRPIAQGDFIRLHLDTLEGEVPERVLTDVRFEVTEPSMARWMLDAVLGKKIDDVVEGISMPDTDASKEEQELLTPKKARLTILHVESPTYPELSDQLAAQLGASSVDDLRQKVAAILNKQAEETVQKALRDQVTDVLLKDYPFDLPMTLVEREVRFRLNQLLQEPEFLEYWQKMTDEARKRTVQALAEQSEKAVRIFYLCQKILNQAGLEVSPEEIEQRPQDPIGLLLNPSGAAAQPPLEGGLQRAEAFSRLLLEKAEDFLISHSTIAE